MKLHVLISTILFIFLLLAGCTKKEQEAPPTTDSPDNPSAIKPPMEPKPLRPRENTSKPASAETILEPNTPIIFYSASVGTQTSDVSYYDVSEGERYGYIGTAKPIRWDTNYRAILGMLPTIKKTYSFHRIVSPSYAPSYIYPKTKNGQLFIFRDWGYPESTDIKDVLVLDPATGVTTESLQLYPSASANIAIVGNSIFYADPINYRRSTYDIVSGSTRTRVGGGNLYKQEFGSLGSVKLLDYGDEDNKGRFYGLGSSLFSIYLNEETNEFEFREHSTSSGKITRQFYTLPNAPDMTIYDGERAFFIVINATDSQLPIYQVHELKTDGETQFLLNIELDSAAHTIEGVDEAGDYLMISTADGVKIDSVVMYGLKDNSFNEIDIEPDIQITHPPSNGDRFILLNQK